jgi:chlorite dismutase
MAEFIAPKHEVPESLSTATATLTPPHETDAAAAVAGRPAGSYGAGPQSRAQNHDPAKPAVKRQVVCFSFYKVMPEWRRLPAEEKAAHKAAFAAVLTKWNKPGEFLSLTNSTIGTRGDVDMCVWSIGYGVDELNEMRSELLRTPLGGYLNSPHNFLAMTKRSQYQIDRVDESEGEGRGAIRPGGQKYIFIYPFWKTRPWYLLSMSERKRLMDEHIRIGLLYPRVKLNTTYSFGLDDQEFVVAFETNFPEDFLDLVQQLRETEISVYTLKDFPIFSCVRVPAMEMLDRLG